MSERMDFAGGKYTVINDNGNLTALRHGEPWKRDLTGDNLVYWMLIEALELKSQRDELLEAIAGLVGCIDHGSENPTEKLDSARAAIAKAIG